MTSTFSTTSPVVRVGIDIAKLTHQILWELPGGKRRSLRVANTKTEIDRFVGMLGALGWPCEIAFEATGDYHRPLAYVLGRAGFRLCLVSSIAVARTREALYNSWDKNDPKDAQVILYLLKQGTTQRYLDPLVTGHQDLQEMADTYQQVSLRKVRLQHSLITHHLPLYFPEAERYLHSSRAEWFTELLLFAPCPAAVRRYTKTRAPSRAGRSTRRGGSPTDRLWQCGATRGRHRRRFGCFGSCSSGALPVAKRHWRSRRDWPRSRTLSACRPCLASGRSSR